MHRMNNADIKQWAKKYTGEPFDGILCDPPYELGFMGKSWDSSGIAFDTEMWADLFKLVKPGGHLLAFSGSRTYHRMAVAIEDAGFEIRDMIEWVYGSGFPKSLNIGKAVDKIQGNEREVVLDELRAKRLKNQTGNYESPNGMKSVNRNPNLSKGNSPYEGYGTALKPAHEPCVLARKPLEKGMTVANNVLKHGTGGLNIDGTRVGTTTKTNSNGKRSTYGGNALLESKTHNAVTTEHNYGRFPANLIHDGSDEVVGLFPDTGKSTGGRIGNKGSMINTMGNAYEKGDPGFGDSGSAARFFYCAKASKSERNAGLEEFDGKEAPYKYGSIKKSEGRTGINTPQSNYHPTVKPLSLTKYLATLIKPPTGGRLLVPFSGSGSEMIGALQAGWEYVEGIELTEEYIPIAEARIKHWLNIKEEETKQGVLL